ncbi:MAG: glycolate oxidase subunit GlcF [Pseudomonadota bacterium]
MQTSFSSEFIQTKDGQRVDNILRNCVHCGFCNATCPTYQLTGDELDGPRGRIYLIKNFFENSDNQVAHNISLKHLDRCLTCMACETTCPSGVKYGELVDIGRKQINSTGKRSLKEKLKRNLILYFFSNSTRTYILLSVARLVKYFLPHAIAKKIPAKIKFGAVTEQPNNTKRSKNTNLLTIKGCVQDSLAPQINHATKLVLNQSGYNIDESNARCCGAMAFHLTELEKAHKTIRENIDEWHNKLKNGYDNILINSSGCSVFIKQYATILQDDPEYNQKAKYISDHCIDLSEITSSIATKISDKHGKTVAFHSPCTLQHGQKINGRIEKKLREAGYTLVEVQDSHLCCGSAGTYSLLEKELSAQLLTNKVHHLEKNQPDFIATANIGCLLHLQSGTDIPVKHWVELLR